MVRDRPSRSRLPSRRGRRATIIPLTVLALGLWAAAPIAPAHAQTAPTLAGISPTSGPASGGTHLTLTGTNFIEVRGVHFGPIFEDATLNCPSTTTCTITTPLAIAGPGTFNVTVETAAGTSNGLPFTYLDTPSLHSISPSEGFEAGGTAVTVTGTGYVPGATTVTFGGVAATNANCTTTSCTVSSPPGTGSVDVVVSTAAGTSNALGFRYLPPAPTITGLTPDRGPAAGGTVVTITGTSLAPEPDFGRPFVFFGSTEVQAESCASNTVCTVVAPAGSGTVAVTVETVSGTSNALNFTYSVGAGEPGWMRLGGPYRGDPSVLTRRDLVFAVGQTGEPFYHERLGAQWGAAIPLGGLLKSDVAPAEALIGPQDPNFEIFGTGIDGAVWYRTRDTGWQSLGGALLSTPAAVSFNGQTYVFGVGLDGAVWFRTPHSGWESLGGIILSDLGLTTDGTALYVTGVGLDDAIWSRRMTGSGWQAWESLGGEVISAPMTTTAGGTGYLFAIGGDGAVWYQGVTGGAWSGWYGLGGIAASAPAVIGHANGALDVFVVGVDSAMWQQHWNGSHWSGWHDRGGGFVSNPAASTAGIFGIGFDDFLWAGEIPA